MVTDPQRVMLDLAALLDALGVPYVVGGSMASSIHGESRATNDVDILLDVSPRQHRPLLEALSREHEVDDRALEVLRGAGTSFSAIHRDRFFKVDFFVAGGGFLDRAQMARRMSVPLVDGAPPLQVLSPEVTSLVKLSLHRDSGGVLERQLRDVAGVLKAQRGQLDLVWLVGAAQRVGVLDALRQVAAECDVTLDDGRPA